MYVFKLEATNNTQPPPTYLLLHGKQSSNSNPETYNTPGLVMENRLKTTTQPASNKDPSP